MIVRKLDGIMIRIQMPDGTWGSRCLTDCTTEERLRWFRSLDNEGLIRTAEHLAQIYRAFGDMLDVEYVGHPQVKTDD